MSSTFSAKALRDIIGLPGAGRRSWTTILQELLEADIKQGLEYLLECPETEKNAEEISNLVHKLRENFWLLQHQAPDSRRLSKIWKARFRLDSLIPQHMTSEVYGRIDGLVLELYESVPRDLELEKYVLVSFIAKGEYALKGGHKRTDGLTTEQVKGTVEQCNKWLEEQGGDQTTVGLAHLNRPSAKGWVRLVVSKLLASNQTKPASK
ncbi:hypothetical protein K469DRAFT_694487 [Zopfia rhizophila CBS 207.26]|uniref:Uncharacterized protein n=1 Tax=Zopfia rhizophila CBS 207.26 TaxID=1314779 RepID=A0A6A6ENT8_9PEZI|nr:hypothetical protein K469DRAFT_694487 [Zopfia rhizophila CBS 207.26]